MKWCHPKALLNRGTNHTNNLVYGQHGRGQGVQNTVRSPSSLIASRGREMRGAVPISPQHTSGIVLGCFFTAGSLGLEETLSTPPGRAPKG